MTQQENMIRVYRYKHTDLFNIYYDTDKDEFCVRKQLYTTDYFSPIEWKYPFRKRKNKNGDDEWIQKEYRQVFLYNPETKKDLELLNLSG
jgi:hypothetical protein